jgi:hypothetical protein
MTSRKRLTRYCDGNRIFADLQEGYGRIGMGQA